MPLSLTEQEELELLELERERSMSMGAVGSSLPKMGAKAVSNVPPREPGSVAGFVKNLGKDTLEMLAGPTSPEAAKRLLSPMPGQFGPSRTAQDVGEKFPPLQDLVKREADKFAGTKLGKLKVPIMGNPVPLSALGTAAHVASFLLPPKLTPSEAALNIGSEGIGFGVHALKPLVGGAGRMAARAAEGISGIEYKAPGALEAAAKDSSLMFAPGKKQAGAAYEGLKMADRIRPQIAEATTAPKIVDEGLSALKSGDITHEEALVVRQALDKMKKSVPNYQFNYLRGMFDDIAKRISANADKGYARAATAEVLRRWLPINKSGGTSIAKGFLGTIAGIVPLLSMSPVLQSAAATTAGIAGRQMFGRTIPGLRAALGNLLRNKGAQNGGQ